jgi:hypothetical protein
LAVEVLGGGGENVEERQSVERVNDIEHPDCFRSLVGLETTDAMEPDTWMSIQQCGPLGRGFLDATFAEVGLPSLNQLLDLGCRPCFRHCHEEYLGRIATRDLGS